MGDYNVLWIDDKIDEIKDRNELHGDNLGPNVNVELIQYFDTAEEYYTENFKNIHGIILDYRAMNNDRDTTGRGSVGMGMLRKLLEKSKNNMQKIPICFATAVPSDISKDALADYEDNYHTEIAVFSKDDFECDDGTIAMLQWMRKRIRRVELMNANPYVQTIDKYLKEGSNQARISFSNMEMKIKNQETIREEDLVNFGKYIESLMGLMPKYTNLSEEIYNKQWSRMTFNDQIYWLSLKQDWTKEKISINGKEQFPDTNNYFTASRFGISYSVIIHQFLNLIRLSKNQGSHDSSFDNMYPYSINQYKILFNAYKELLNWFDHIYKDKFTQKFGS
jgi:hypothetical protein